MDEEGRYCPPRPDHWVIRRWILAAVLAFCMWTVAYSLYKDLQSEVAEAAVTFAFLTIAGVVGSYVFGRTWEDIRSRMGVSK